MQTLDGWLQLERASPIAPKGKVDKGEYIRTYLVVTEAQYAIAVRRRTLCHPTGNLSLRMAGGAGIRQGFGFA
jgi:hypothetical protein